MKLLELQKCRSTQRRSKLKFTTTGGGSWKVWDRYLSLGPEQLVHLGNVCGTCRFFFNIVAECPLDSVELGSTREQLEMGLECIGTIAKSFLAVLPRGHYQAALFEMSPGQAGTPGNPDYFECEQREAWRYEPEADEGACSLYYRSGTRSMGSGQMLFEFVVPLFGAAALDDRRVAHYMKLMSEGCKPTAVAVSVLDVKSSMEWPEDEKGNDVEPEFDTHWCFANYLLDGHHKVQAAHRANAPMTLLSFIALEPSWQRVDDLVSAYQGKPPPYLHQRG